MNNQIEMPSTEEYADMRSAIHKLVEKFSLSLGQDVTLLLTVLAERIYFGEIGREDMLKNMPSMVNHIIQTYDAYAGKPN